MKFTQLLSLASIVLCASSAAAQSLGLQSGAVRIATVDGLTDHFAGIGVSMSSSVAPGPMVSRANGSSSWDGVSSDGRNRYVSFFDLASGLTAANAEALTQDNFKGTWQVSWDGSTSFGYDTTPYYIPVMDRQYLELTASSAALFADIRANGLTGTFNFELTQPYGGSGNAYFGQAAGFVFFTGSSFSMTISQALASDELLYVQRAEGHSLGFGGPGMATEIRMSQAAITVYGLSIPAPGAIALLGLAGLAGRRRR